MSKSTLSFQERAVIQDWHDSAKSLRSIARHLNRSVSTISYELHRLRDQPYSATAAKNQTTSRRTQRGRKTNLTANLNDFITEGIRVRHLSFAQIAQLTGEAKRNFYNWLAQGRLEITSEELPDRAIRYQRSHETRGKAACGRSIEERTNNGRKTIGQFEADTVLSGKKKGQALATVVDRASRLTITRRLSGRDSGAMKAVLVDIASLLGDNFKTVTVDHGKEFAKYQEFEDETGKLMYFAHAYSPHERGTNEQRNKILRRFVPKGRPIEDITDEELVDINWKMNTMPLECLNWRTPLEVFWEQMRF